jgi:hypothetical protein
MRMGHYQRGTSKKAIRENQKAKEEHYAQTITRPEDEIHGNIDWDKVFEDFEFEPKKAS